MNDAYSILNVDKEQLKDFHLLAKNVDSIQVQRTINLNVRQLRAIEERMYVEGSPKVPKQTIDEILAKVVLSSKLRNNKEIEWRISELRIISYNITGLQNDQCAYEYALSIIARNWRDIYINGLVFALMNSWNRIKPEMRKKTSQLLVEKLQNYDGKNTRYNMLKNKANMLEESGPQRLAYLLLNQNKDLKEAPLLLGFKATALHMLYFSDVIITYCKKQRHTQTELEQVFQLHSAQRTKQLVLANEVIAANAHGNVAQQTILSKYINRTLGDITLKSTWAPCDGATEEEQVCLKQAMHYVNLWFNRRIIESFFEICVQDKDRKLFWLNYVDRVSGFKIVGSLLTKRTLQSDSRVSGMFQSNFVETNSTSSITAALVLYINNYVLVEFSNTGCLYAYKQNHKKAQLLSRIYHISSVNDLKEPSIEKLVDENEWWTNYNQEGRLQHRGAWQRRMRNWLEKIVLCNSTIDKSLF